jgi:hypothetical protein
MNTYAIIETATGTILNRILLDDASNWTPEDGHSVVKEDDESFAIGGNYLNGIYTAPDHPNAPEVDLPPCPSSISDRQFFQQLAIAGIITEEQALASNAAVIPPPLLDIINGMPAEQQFGAKMLVSGATVFERHHPMTEAIGAAYGWTAAQIDGFFRAAALL